jgi:steroid 5-alpha reductase family enzyme
MQMVHVLVNSIKSVFPKLAISQFIGWGISYIIDNHTFVDVAWGLNHLIFAGISCTNSFTDFSSLKSNPRNMVGMFLISLWFTRLSGFLFKERIFKRHVDPRYEEMAQKRKLNNNIHTFIQFQLQGFISLFTGFSINYLFTNPSNSLGPLGVVGAITCIVGVIGEAIADKQLQNFKNTNTEKGKTFRGGLFKHSRHPNLFFDIVFWTGIAIYSINPSNIIGSLPTFFGPLCLWFVMAKLTIPVTEKHMKKTRPDWDKTLKETNTFWPIKF